MGQKALTIRSLSDRPAFSVEELRPFEEGKLKAGACLCAEQCWGRLEPHSTLCRHICASKVCPKWTASL